MVDFPKAPTSGKLPLEYIDSLIAKTNYTRVPDSTMTICTLTTISGYIVTGESACLDKADYDESLGDKYAFEQARDKLWELETYRQHCDRANATDS